EYSPKLRQSLGRESAPGFCCADAADISPIDANRRLQKRTASVSGLFFTGKIPTAACGGANDFRLPLVWKQSRELLCALQLALLIHHRVGRGDELGDNLAATGDGIAFITSRLEEIRRGHPVAPCRGHPDDVEAVAIAGEVHHLEFGGAENRAISL